MAVVGSSQDDGHPSHHLPAALTDLVGRETELATAGQMLLNARVRLVTFTGPPGAGKTRLALAIAEDVRPSFEDGVWFVPLAALSDADLVAGTIAEVIGVRPMGRRPVAEAVIHALRQRHSLLVLDNFEHLLPAGRLLLDLLESCPALKILVTSRARLRVSGEHLLIVPPLQLPTLEPLPSPEDLSHVAAVRLFIDRAQAVEPGFGMSTTNARAVAELCVRLDGLPLAIELAAAHLALLEPHQLLERFEGRLSLLSHGPRDLPARQRTLRGAIGWSYDLLAAEDQRLFRSLGVFVGGCTLAAAQAVASASSESHHHILLRIEALLELSLLHRVTEPRGEPRIEMLETVREYAQEQLVAAGELEGAQQRHAEYFLGVGEQVANPRLDDADGPALMTELERDHDNLRAALRWMFEQGPADAGVRLAGALWSFWEKKGHWNEGVRWLESALARDDGVSRSARARALIGLAIMYRERSEYSRAAQLGYQSVQLQRELDDPVTLSASLTMFADILALSGDAPSAATLAAEGTALRERNPVAKAWSLFVQGMIAAYQSDFVHAREYYEAGLAIRAGRGGANEVDANLLHGLGALRAGAGDTDAARPFLEQSLARFRARGEARGVARVLLSLGALLARRGETALGRATLEESLTLFQSLGEGIGVALCSLMLGVAHPESVVPEFSAAALANWWRANLGCEAPRAENLAMRCVVPPRESRSGDQSVSAVNTLTRREREVLALIGRRYSNREIADELVLSVRTVERHITNIYAKTGLSSRRLAERYADYVNT